MASSSSSSSTGSYDVFPRFSGEDVRKTFLSHFLKELIFAFKDNEIKRSRSVTPELKNASRNSRIAVAVLNYASSSWCLNELLEIVKCKKEFGPLVIPIFYRLDPSNVRKQTGDFGKIQWRGFLTDVANSLGYHIVTWDNEASMIEEITNDVFGKLNLSPLYDFEEFVVIEDHITNMSSLLYLESEEVRMVGIWGPSGIGKTSIERVLFSGLSCQFQSIVFDDFPHKLRLLRFDEYPKRCLLSSFRLENLVKFQMRYSKLEKLWEGVHIHGLQALTGLKNMDLMGSENLKEIADLSMATNLETLSLLGCGNLVEIPSSIQYLHKLNELDLSCCKNLETLPTGINLKSLCRLFFNECSLLKRFPDISTDISLLDIGYYTAIEGIPYNLPLQNLVDFTMCKIKSDEFWKRGQPLSPLNGDAVSVFDKVVYVGYPKFGKLKVLIIANCRNLETLPTRIKLKSLSMLDLRGCSLLRTFPYISTNISYLYLDETGIKEVPRWIKKFSRLYILEMKGCNHLRRVSLNIYKLKRLKQVDFSDCGALADASWNRKSSAVATATDNLHSNLPIHHEDSFSLPKYYVPRVLFNFINCFKLDHEALLQQQSVFKELRLSGEEVPSYFTHRTTGTSLNNIPLPQTSPSKPIFSFRACAVVDVESISPVLRSFEIQVCFRFMDRPGNYFDSADFPRYFSAKKLGGHLVIFDFCFPLADQLKYEHVDIQFCLQSDNSQFKLKGCGILLHENSPSVGNRPCNSNILPHDCEGNTSSSVNLGGNDTQHNQECGDSAVERKSSRKKLLVMTMGRLLKKLLRCYASNPQATKEDVSC